eukprot:3457337-Rhodomonas_salina.1
MLLRARYAMSGTDLGHDPPWQRRGEGVTGSELRSRERSVSAYAVAMRCPGSASVLETCPGTYRLRDCYAMSGTKLAYAAVCLRACYAMSGTDIAYAAIGMWALCAIPGTDIVYSAMCLCACYAIPGREGGGAGAGGVCGRRSVDRERYNTPVWSYALAMPCPVLRCVVPNEIDHVTTALCDARYCARLWYSMHGPAVVPCYAIRGTDFGCGATRREDRASTRARRRAGSCPILLRACYELYGTDLAYPATIPRACYAMSGTELAYGAMRCP